MSIPVPNNEMRLVALGARFAVEQQHAEQMVALANERDEALRMVAERDQKITELEQTLSDMSATAHMLADEAAVPPRNLHEFGVVQDLDVDHDHPPSEECHDDCPKYVARFGTSAQVYDGPDVQCVDCLRPGFSDGRVKIGHGEYCSRPGIVAPFYDPDWQITTDGRRVLPSPGGTPV